MAILGRPEVLFLDEPTSGLDPRGMDPPANALLVLAALILGTAVFVLLAAVSTALTQTVELAPTCGRRSDQSRFNRCAADYPARLDRNKDGGSSGVGRVWAPA